MGRRNGVGSVATSTTQLSMKFIAIFILFPFLTMAQFDLTVTVTNVKSTDGKISMAVYDNAESWLKFDRVLKANTAPAKKGRMVVVIEGLPEWRYAVTVFHDENANDELDTNMFGIPREPLGFSKGKMKTFGPPDFEECSFELTSDLDLSVRIK